MKSVSGADNFLLLMKIVCIVTLAILLYLVETSSFVFAYSLSNGNCTKRFDYSEGYLNNFTLIMKVIESLNITSLGICSLTFLVGLFQRFYENSENKNKKIESIKLILIQLSVLGTGTLFGKILKLFLSIEDQYNCSANTNTQIILINIRNSLIVSGVCLFFSLTGLIVKIGSKLRERSRNVDEARIKYEDQSLSSIKLDQSTQKLNVQRDASQQKKFSQIKDFSSHKQLKQKESNENIEIGIYINTNKMRIESSSRSSLDANPTPDKKQQKFYKESFDQFIKGQDHALRKLEDKKERIKKQKNIFEPITKRRKRFFQNDDNIKQKADSMNTFFQH